MSAPFFPRVAPDTANLTVGDPQEDPRACKNDLTNVRRPMTGDGRRSMADGTAPSILCVACLIAVDQGLPPLTYCCGRRARELALLEKHLADVEEAEAERAYWERIEQEDAECPLDVLEEAARSGVLDDVEERAERRERRRGREEEVHDG